MIIDENDYLAHHGIKGMKWGVRRTPEQLGHRIKSTIKKTQAVKKKAQQINRAQKLGSHTTKDGKKDVAAINKEILKANPAAAVVDYSKGNGKGLTPEQKAKLKKALMVGAVAVGATAATAYYVKNKKQIDQTVANVLNKSKNKKLSDVSSDNGYENSKKIFKSIGISIESEEDAVRANFIASWLKADKHRYDPITDEQYRNLDTNDLTLSAGQIFGRMSGDNETSIGDRIYCAFDEDDKNRYKGFLPAMWKKNGRTVNNLYSIELEATTEIRSPSAKKRVDILTDLIKNDSDFRNNIAFMPGESDEQASKRIYYEMAGLLANRYHPLGNKYLEKVKELGYNAIIDDNDAGRLAKNPLIILDPKAIKIKGSKQLSTEDLKNAWNSIKPMKGESVSNLADITDNYLLMEWMKDMYEISDEIVKAG